ncbi:MAG: ECF transporter S component [Bacilli bacterium]|nr:ECF transporter S component [Bacilli bacterium]
MNFNFNAIALWIILGLYLILGIAIYKKSYPTEHTTRSIAIDALFIAIILLMGLVPNIGYISIPPFGSITLMHLPVILGACLFGWKKGTLYGLIFGLTSWYKAAAGGTAGIDLYFAYPWISVLPRVLFGFLSGLFFTLLKKNSKLYRNGLLIALAAAISTCVHTILVYLDLAIFFPNVMFGNQATMILFISGFALGMAGEAALAAIVVGALGKITQRFVK